MGLMKKLTSAVVASSLVLGSMGVAFAAPTADQQAAGYARMSELKLVTGNAMPDGSVSADLDGTLTRAQILTIIARAFGQEQNAALLSGLESFSDVPAGQWYSGYVAVAKQLASAKGFSVGYPDGSFQPNNQVTNIEALTFIMKFLGVQTGTGDNWVADTIASAQAAGVITEADVATYLDAPNAPATRGSAFALADQIFATYNKLPGGKTVYTGYTDTAAPALTVVKPAAPTTNDATYTVTGTADQDAKVYVNGTEITTSNGTFSYEVALNAGENTVAVTASDVAGNVTESSFTLTRVAGAAAAIKVESTEVEYAAGSEVELAYSVVDASGLELADAKAGVKVVASAEVGTYADGKLAVAEKAGGGTITLSYEGLEDVTLNVKVVAGALTAVGAEVDGVRVDAAAPGESVTLVATDAFGNKIEGATFAESEANAFLEDDQFTASKAGSYTVTATVGETSVEAEVAVYGDVDTFKIEVPETMVANNATEYTVTVKAVDEEGALVRTFDEEVELYGDFAAVDGVDRVKAENGVATFKVTVAEDLEEGVLVASYDDIEAEIEVETVAQEASAIEITASDFLGLGSRALPFSGSVDVVDQEGEAMLSDDDEWDITLEIDGPAYLVDSNDDEESEIEVTVDKDGGDFDIVSKDDDTEGEVTITATAKDLDSASKTIKAIWASSPKNLTIKAVDPDEADEDIVSTKALYRIGLTDRNGVPVKPSDDYKVTLAFNTDELSVWTMTGSEAPSYEEIEAETNELTLVSKKADTYFDDDEADDVDNYVYVLIQPDEAGDDVSMKASAAGFTSASVDVEYTAGDADDLDFDTVVAIRDGQTKTVEFQVVDKNDVAVDEVVRIKLTTEDRIRLAGKRDSLTLYTDASGKASVEIAPEWNMGDSGEILVFADIDKDGLEADNSGSEDYVNKITVNRATNAAAKLSVTSELYGSEEEVDLDLIPSGEKLVLTVEVKDRAGRVIDDHDTDLDVTEAKVGSNATVNLGALAGTNGVYTFEINTTALDGTYKVTFTDNNSINQPSKSVTFTVINAATTPYQFDLDSIDGTETVGSTVTEYVYGSFSAPGTVKLELDAYNGSDAVPAADYELNVEVSVEGDGYVLVNGVRKSEFTVTAQSTDLELAGDTTNGKKVKFTFTADGFDPITVELRANP